MPQRRRGHERVAALLEAAAACFAEKGYDATTMTEVAARAGASIGSLYQYFATKELLAQALMAGYAQDLDESMASLGTAAADWGVDELADGLIQSMLEFRRGRPAFVALAEAVGSTLPVADSLAIRRQLRRHLQTMFAVRSGRPAEELQAVAVATLQLMKAAVAINAEPGLAGRRAALDELRLALRSYLRTALQA